MGEPSHTGVPRLTFNNQADTVTQQLNNGARALMLDTYDFKEDVWLCHSFGGKCYDFTAYNNSLPFNKYGFLTTHNSHAIEGEPSHTGVPRVTFNNQADKVTQQLNLSKGAGSFGAVDTMNGELFQDQHHKLAQNNRLQSNKRKVCPE
ncbi:unnamed protein product [Lupinus luteus]|uniref:Uncharacterized protein n=1 Tax=Lupinus luteus TaxID=3873 RepID=A0AAV1WZM2_LUPLU